MRERYEASFQTIKVWKFGAAVLFYLTWTDVDFIKCANQFLDINMLITTPLYNHFHKNIKLFLFRGNLAFCIPARSILRISLFLSLFSNTNTNDWPATELHQRISYFTFFSVFTNGTSGSFSKRQTFYNCSVHWVYLNRKQYK